MERKKLILVVLLILLGLAIGYRIQHPFKQKRVSKLRYAGRTGKEAQERTRSIKQKSIGKDLGQTSLVDIDLFLSPIKHSAVVIRDPFFEKPRQVKVARKRPVSSRVMQPKQTVVAEDPIQKVKRELAQFRVFGSFESDGQIALFVERGRDILVVRKGDWIDGRFQLKDISPDSITIWAREIGQDIHIALGE